jgi:hypothetical protein
MKPSQPNHLPQSLLQLLCLALLAAFTSSCATSGKSDPSTHVEPTISRSWVKVSSKPPTWFPRGVPADHPSDFKSGDWVYVEDPKGTRFFIPLHGISKDRRKVLQSEALAARHPATVQRIKNGEVVRKTKAVGSFIVMLPFMALAGLGGP